MNLITRSDFDGLVCAVLLKHVEIIQKVTFAEPSEIQKRFIDVTGNDILANLPYNPACGMWFDHHESEGERTDFEGEFEGRFELAPSAARVIWNHYRSHRFHKYEYLAAEVDRIDSAKLTVEDVTDPDGWVLLSYVLDPRTGLSRYEGPGIGNKELPHRMIDLISDYTASEILGMHDIRLRVRDYFKQEERFREMLRSNSRLEDHIVITDTRGMAEVPRGNRFFIYTLFPDANISIRIFDEEETGETGVAIAHSIFNRTSFTNVGDLCARHGGGGHERAGALRLSPEEADSRIKEIVQAVKERG